MTHDRESGLEKATPVTRATCEFLRTPVYIPCSGCARILDLRFALLDACDHAVCGACGLAPQSRN